MLGFRAQQETVESSGSADGVDGLSPSRQHLVDIALVRNIEEELVLRAVKDTVQSHSEFHDAKIGPQMASSACQGMNECMSDLLTEILELVIRQCLDVFGTFDAG